MRYGTAAIAAALVLSVALVTGKANAQYKARGVSSVASLVLPPATVARPFSGTFEAIAEGDKSDVKLILTLSENAGRVTGQVNGLYFDPRQGLQGWYQATGYPTTINAQVTNGSFASPFGDGSVFYTVYWCGGVICASAYSGNLQRYFLLQFMPAGARQAQS